MKVGSKSSIVVQQSGAAGSLETHGELRDYVILVTQMDQEDLTQLAERVRRAARDLAARQVSLDNMLFIARPGFDQDDVPATADLLRGVVAHMVEQGHGEAYLQAADDDPLSGYALGALAAAMSEQVRGTGVQVINWTPIHGRRSLSVPGPLRNAAGE